MCKKIFSIVIAIALCCCLCIPAQAVENSCLDNIKNIEKGQIVQPYYNYTVDAAATLQNSSGKAKCTTTVNGYIGTTTKIKTTMTLQRKFVVVWTDVETWTTTVNDYYSSVTKTTSVTGGTYRVKAECVVYSGSNSETITKYSSERAF